MQPVAPARRRARLLLFAEPRAPAAKLLVEAAIRASRERQDIEVIAVCDTGRVAPRRLDAPRHAVAALAKQLFDPAHPVVLHRPMLESLPAVCRRLGVPLLVPPGRDVNSPAFLDRVRRELRPDLALSLICLQVFSAELLAVFERAVNYHNGLLPAYRGLRATAWSVYRAEPVTGFSYHVMTERLDEGPVLVEDAVPVWPAASVSELEWEKTQRAATHMSEVLDALMRGAPGRAQTGPPSYFGKRELRTVRAVGDPAALSWSELGRRLRAFDLVTVTLSGTRYHVTRFRRTDGGRPGRRALTFLTRDGVTAEPDRFRHLPLPLYRCYRALAPSAGEPRW